MADAIVSTFNPFLFDPNAIRPYAGVGMLADTYLAEYCSRSDGLTVFLGPVYGTATNTFGTLCVAVVDTHAFADPSSWTVLDVVQFPDIQIYAFFFPSYARFYPPMAVDRKGRQVWIMHRKPNYKSAWAVLDADTLAIEIKSTELASNASVWDSFIGDRYIDIGSFVSRENGSMTNPAAFAGIPVGTGYYGPTYCIDKGSGIALGVWYENPVLPWIATLLSLDIEHTSVVATNMIYNNLTNQTNVKCVYNSTAGNVWVYTDASLGSGTVFTLTDGVTLGGVITTLGSGATYLWDVPEMGLIVANNGVAYDALTGASVTMSSWWPRTIAEGRDVMVTEKIGFDSFGTTVSNDPKYYYMTNLQPVTNGICTVQSTTAVCVVPTEDSTVASSQVQTLDAPHVGTYAIRATCGQKCSTTGTIDIGITSAQSMQGQSVQARTWLFSGGV